LGEPAELGEFGEPVTDLRGPVDVWTGLGESELDGISQSEAIPQCREHGEGLWSEALEVELVVMAVNDRCTRSRFNFGALPMRLRVGASAIAWLAEPRTSASAFFIALMK